MPEDACHDECPRTREAFDDATGVTEASSVSLEAATTSVFTWFHLVAGWCTPLLALAWYVSWLLNVFMLVDVVR